MWSSRHAHAPWPRPSVGRFCYLVVAIAAAIVMLHHHNQMQQEIDINRRSRDQMERLYEAMRRQEGEWKAKAEDERLRLAEVMDACGKVRQQLASELTLSQQQEQQIRALQEELRAARANPKDDKAKKPPEGGNP
ncbi:hypothetical protein CLOM_g11783 [Closterium sp. NIES-68]|nr:hypothetical protein CLOM_g11783 [Closterium sp. NIES-68]GJP82135.1 hypothetical protein CLOP_g12352 [Closterium sp. NIES-67]